MTARPRKTFHERLFEHYFVDLVSIIPPGAQLVPSSKIPPQHLGKVPGKRYGSGMWGGYDWRRHQPTIDDVRAWGQSGAGCGLRADHYPGIDIDCTDETTAAFIERIALKVLGRAPIRTGNAPKRLLMYGTTSPFGRMRLWFKIRGEQHLVEVLGQGQQYVVHGTHPATLQPYDWDVDIEAVASGELTDITREQADEFLDQLARALDMTGATQIEREGDGRASTRTAATNQDELLAPSIERLREAVELIPNTNELFPSRQDYLRMGYAIRAASGDDTDESFSIFAAWANRWDGNDRTAGNDPETVHADWRRMRGPYAVGWSWIGEQARPFGFNDMADVFSINPNAEIPSALPGSELAPEFSDAWCAQQIVARKRGMLRYSPESSRWFVWNGSRWEPDSELQAESVIDRELRTLANALMRTGATMQEKARAIKHATVLCSTVKSSAVTAQVKRDRSIAVSMAALDADPWLLNTPGGIVELRTGDVLLPDPDALCTKATAVPVDGTGACPEWRRFLAEATGGDHELEAYLQRLAGYALTGDTREQHLTFLWGPGGNGKSVFLNTISGIMGDYARVAPLNMFTASQFDGHPTDLASLHGARLVTASETQAGRRWDEARIKSLTGGEPVTARFMRQDHFTFSPQFKLLFAGNHQPGIGSADDAMRRRMHMVPFTAIPRRVDRDLAAKLRAEWPAILAWMIDGCRQWNELGLAPPARVLASTEQYFADQDALQQWLVEECDREVGASEELRSLFHAWSTWCGGAGELAGTERDFSKALSARGYSKSTHPRHRRVVFQGIRLLSDDAPRRLLDDHETAHA